MLVSLFVITSLRAQVPQGPPVPAQWGIEVTTSRDGMEAIISLPTQDSTRRDHDLFSAFRLADGSWSIPASLRINTNEDERTPFFSDDGITVYFSRGNESSSKIFFTRRDSVGVWSEPLTLTGRVNAGGLNLWPHVQGFSDTIFIQTNRALGAGKFETFRYPLAREAQPVSQYIRFVVQNEVTALPVANAAIEFSRVNDVGEEFILAPLLVTGEDGVVITRASANARYKARLRYVGDHPVAELGLAVSIQTSSQAGQTYTAIIRVPELPEKIMMPELVSNVLWQGEIASYVAGDPRIAKASHLRDLNLGFDRATSCLHLSTIDLANNVDELVNEILLQLEQHVFPLASALGTDSLIAMNLVGYLDEVEWTHDCILKEEPCSCVPPIFLAPRRTLSALLLSELRACCTEEELSVELSLRSAAYRALRVAGKIAWRSYGGGIDRRVEVSDSQKRRVSLTARAVAKKELPVSSRMIEQ